MNAVATGGSLRETLKGLAGGAAAQVSRQCQFERAVFVLAHMRCGSTALSNILCSRREISGYGEAHIRYSDRAALGHLVVNQALRRSWSPKAPYLFDKILHNRHDQAAPDAFFSARAIFVVRPPGAAVQSIRTLYVRLERTEYGSDQCATEYYIQRLNRLAAMWPRFHPSRRVGVTSPALLSTPDAALAQISDRLGFSPALENRYQANAAVRKGGAGDPLVSVSHTRIEARTMSKADPLDSLQISDTLKQKAQDTYQSLVGLISG